MVSDQEIARSVESLLRQTDPNSVTTLSGVVQQLEVELGLDLSHKAGFIRDQINLLLRSHPQQPPQPPSHLHHNPQKDHFALQNHPQYQTTTHPQQFPPHFALHRPESHMCAQPRPSPVPQPHHPAQSRSHPQVPKQPELFAQTTAVILSPEAPRESAPAPAKRKGGPGGLNKVCGVSPELQAIVGEAALPRTEIVKQLWAYIRKNNLQDPSNKRKIICDDALRVVFETDCTDMFKMNKLLAKHIIALGPTKESSQAKRAKVDVETSTESTNPGSSTVIISEALAKFLSSSEREMPETEASSRVWEHVKVNNLEDPMNSMIILCDAKLRELLGCESISALGIQEMLNRHHIFKQS